MRETELIIALVNNREVKDKLVFLAFLAGGALPAFGYSAAILLLLASLPFFSMTTLRKNALFIALISQYFVIQLLLSYFHNGALFLDGRDKHYLIMLFVTLPIICLASHGRDHPKQVLGGLQIGLALAIAFLGWDHFQKSCRGSGMVFNPLGTAGLLLLLGFALASFWPTLGARQRYISGVILTFSIVSVASFTGARMALYSLTLCLILTVLALLRGSFKNNVIKHISVVFFMAIALTYWFDTIKPCRLTNRIEKTFTAITIIAGGVEETQLAPSNIHKKTGEAKLNKRRKKTGLTRDKIDSGIPSSEAVRLAQWSAALQIIPRSWSFGYGAMNERTMLQPISGNDQPHAHNQYLSWLVAGGYLGLISGLLMYFSLPMATKNKSLALLIIGPFITSQLTDSLISTSQMVVLIPLAIMIAYAAMPKQNKV